MTECYFNTYTKIDGLGEVFQSKFNNKKDAVNELMELVLFDNKDGITWRELTEIKDKLTTFDEYKRCNKNYYIRKCESLMTPKEATKIVDDAFKVIVDGVLGANSHPKESCQKKYEKVDNVTQEVVDVLDREFELTLNIYYNIRSKIARGILKFKENNRGSYLVGKIPPEEWMFVYGY